jgi:hypothetical protein
MHHLALLRLRTFNPQGIMDHHDHAGFHIPLSENSIQPQDCGFDEVSFDLLWPSHFEAALQSLAGIFVESPDPAQRTSHYTVILSDPLEILPFSVEEFLHSWIPVMELIYVPLRRRSTRACRSSVGRARFLLRISELTLLASRGAEIPKQIPKFTCLARSRSIPNRRAVSP